MTYIFFWHCDRDEEFYTLDALDMGFPPRYCDHGFCSLWREGRKEKMKGSVALACKVVGFKNWKAEIAVEHSNSQGHIIVKLVAGKLIRRSFMPAQRNARLYLEPTLV